MRIIKIIWQLPQVILGFILSRGAERKAIGDIVYYQWNRKGSISLGPYIIVDTPFSVDHERAHSKQSLILGPLYLIVIGLPSIIWCGLYTYTQIGKKYDYFSFYTEAWAERIRASMHR